MGVKDRLEVVARLTRLGTVTEFAEAAGIKSGTAQKHKDRDSIPAKKVPLYLAAARKHGVDVSFEWLQAGRGSPPKLIEGYPVPASVPKIPSDKEPSNSDKDSALRLPLWQINVSNRGANETVQVLTESRDKVLATEALRDINSSFAVRMWDSSNGPYLPRGTILYVERPYGGSAGELCLFGESQTDTEVVRPIVGILDREDEAVWVVLQHTTTMELAKSEFPICWRIKNTKRD